MSVIRIDSEDMARQTKAIVETVKGKKSIYLLTHRETCGFCVRFMKNMELPEFNKMMAATEPDDKRSMSDTGAWYRAMKKPNSRTIIEWDTDTVDYIGKYIKEHFGYEESDGSFYDDENVNDQLKAICKIKASGVPNVVRINKKGKVYELEARDDATLSHFLKINK
jgi:hypothetical protein